MGAVMIQCLCLCPGAPIVCLNSILSRGWIPWQLHKYLHAVDTLLCLRSTRLQATCAIPPPPFNVDDFSWVLFFLFLYLLRRQVFLQVLLSPTHHLTWNVSKSSSRPLYCTSKCMRPKQEHYEGMVMRSILPHLPYFTTCTFISHAMDFMGIMDLEI